MTRGSSNPALTQSKNPRSKKAKASTVKGPFVNYEAGIDFLNSRINLEQIHASKIKPESFKLDRMHALVKELGDPHLAVPTVHIAGSKGKGSTCTMLESCLRASGYTTGLFTSPHLIDERERIQINNQLVDKDRFIDALAKCKDAASAIANDQGQASYFELLTAAAFVVFAEEAVDIVILETGLGGRLDCTNVARPIVVGLTDIQLEHTDVLGDTLKLIATEKAGIIKPNTKAISVPQPDEVIEVFRNTATDTGATLEVLGDDILYSCRFQSATTKGPHPKVCVGSGEGCFEHMSVPLMGEHQGANCALALAIILELRTHGFDLPEQQIIAGLEHTPRDGRLEQINERPRVYIDGAHTPDSVRETLKAISQQIRYDSLIVVFGCSADKKIDGMIEELTTRADKVVFTKASSNARAVDPKSLSEMYTERSTKSSEAYGTPTEAIRAAGKSLGANDALLILGSFYLAGEVKALFQAKHAKAHS
ncbi:MAG: bifunctional folylpolyglutamate synthase/dihydrofolate synthase [Phycisphaerales bacterium]|nr:bifunctional folylpolyglutamate synthase/dihydrofolate synthase [Phycisphaerales bacterium]